MSSSKITDQERILSRLGFTPKRDRATCYWTSPQASDDERLVLIERSNTLRFNSISATWNLENLGKTLQQELISQWGRNIRVWHQIKDTCAVAVMVEILPPPSPSKRPIPRLEPPAVVGWTFRLTSDGDIFKTYIEHYTCLGTPPEHWLADAVQVSLKVLWGKASRFAESRSLHEFECPALAVLLFRANNKASFEDIELIQTAVTTPASQTHRGGMWVRNDRQWKFQWTSEGDPAKTQEVSLTDEPGFAVLESRAATPPQREFDRSLLNRNPIPMSKDDRTPAGMKRRVLASLHGLDESLAADELFALSPAVSHQDIDGLTAAAFVQCHYRSGQMPEAVQALRTWTEVVRKSYGDPEDINALDIALPEWAGIFLAEIDPERALAAWERAQIERDDPRILARMANTIAAEHIPTQELAVLDRWAALERRDQEIKSIKQRKFELQLETGATNEAAKSIETLIHDYPQDGAKWVPQLASLAEHGMAQKSLVLFDRLEKFLSNPNNSDPAGMAAIHAAVAHVWEHHLNRPDLALPRHNMVLNHQAQATPEAVIAAESALIKSGDIATSFTSKLNRWNRFTKEQRLAGKLLGLEILDHCRITDDVVHEFAVSLTFLECGIFPPDFVDRIQAWMPFDCDWNLLITTTMQSFTHDQIPLPVIKTFSRVAREKMHDHALAVSLLSQAAIAVALDDHDFAYLMDHWTNLGQQEELRKALLARVQSPNPDSRQLALKYLVKFGVFDQDGIIHHTLASEWQEHQDPHLIIDRLNSLLESNHYNQAKNLVSVIEEDLAGRSGVHLLTQDLIETTLLHRRNDVDEIVKILLRLDVETSGHDSVALQRAVRVSCNGPDPKSAAPYLRELLDRGIAIDLPDSIVERALAGDPRPLTQHFIHRMNKGSQAERNNHARTAMELLKKSVASEDYMIPVIRQIIQAGEVTLDDLSTIRNIARDLEQPQLVVDSLVCCADNSDDYAQKRPLKMEAAAIAQHELQDYPLAHQLLETVLDPYSLSQDLIDLAEIAYKAGDTARSQQLLLSFLRNPECIEHTSLTLNACRVLIASQEDRSLVESVIQTLISWAQTARATAFMGDLIEFAINYGYASVRDLMKSVEAALAQGDMETTVRCAIKILQKAEQQKDTAANTCDWMKEELVRLGHENAWWQIIGKLTNPAMLNHLSNAARREVLFRYGIWLYEQDGRQTEALQVMLDLAKDSPGEKRIWIPFYILLDELGEHSMMVIHLERVIPLIEKDPSVLSSYPIHVETLKSSLRRAKERVKKGQWSKPEITAELNPALKLQSKTKGMDRYARVASMSDKEREMTVAKPEVPFDPVAGFSLDTGSTAANLQPAPEVAFQHESIPVTKLAPVPEPVEDQPTKIAATPSTPVATQEIPPAEPMAASERVTRITPLPSGTSPAEQVTVIKPIPGDVAANPLHWRDMAINRKAPADATDKLLNMAFASEIEKHMALQVSALLNGNLKALEPWHWRVWREPDEFGYALSARERLPKLSDLTRLTEPLHKFLNAFAPILARNHRERFVISDYLRARHAGASLVMREIKFDHPAIQRTGLRYYQNRFQQAKIVFVDTPGLKDDIFLDAASRCIHFSSEACMDKPPGYLMHRAMCLLWTMNLQYHVILRCDAMRDIIPLCAMFLSHQAATPLDRIRSAFSADGTRIQRLIQGLNTDKIAALADQASPIVPAEVFQLQLEMQKQIHRIVLTETLDLVGLCESVLGESVEQMDQTTFMQRLESSPILQDLFGFSTKIIF